MSKLTFNFKKSFCLLFLKSNFIMKSLFFLLIVILLVFMINKYYNKKDDKNDKTINFLITETDFSDYFRITNIDNMYKGMFTELINPSNEVNSYINMQNNFIRF